MIIIKKYCAEDKDVWDEFVDNSKNGTFMLKRDYMDYHSDRFVDNSLMFYDEDKLIALLPASKHGDELRSHGGLTYGGIICGEKMKQHTMLECFSSLKDFMIQANLKKLIYKTIPHIYHSAPAEEDLYALFVNNAKLFRRDVSTTIDLQNIFKMPKGRKAQISRARREGVIIEETDDFVAFIELENKVLQEHHQTKAVHTADELKLLKNRFPEQIRLFGAFFEGKLISGALIFEYSMLAHTQYMASDEKGREIGALDLLIATLIDKYKNNKKYFDFGISTEDGGRYLNNGLISQKEGFGGRAIVYDFYELEI